MTRFTPADHFRALLREADALGIDVVDTGYGREIEIAAGTRIYLGSTPDGDDAVMLKEGGVTVPFWHIDLAAYRGDRARTNNWSDTDDAGWSGECVEHDADVYGDCC